MKAYITKYALTLGIMEVEAEQSPVAPNMVSWKIPSEWYENHAHGEGKDWHRTKESAVARAEKMRLAKISSLKKAIKKLESLKFA
jgi:hypothetical protein